MLIVGGARTRRATDVWPPGIEASTKVHGSPRFPVAGEQTGGNQDVPPNHERHHISSPHVHAKQPHKDRPPCTATSPIPLVVSTTRPTTITMLAIRWPGSK
jgi:hypothetical protein